MKRKKVFIIIVLMILFVPFIAYADTWLDKEEYRDIVGLMKVAILQLMNIQLILKKN